MAECWWVNGWEVVQLFEVCTWSLLYKWNSSKQLDESQNVVTYIKYLSFIPFWSVFPFSWAPPLLLHIFSLLLHVHNHHNYLEPCALNAEFQHFFIPRFNKTSFYFADVTQRERDRGWIEAQRQGEDRMTFKENSIRKVVKKKEIC